MNHLLKPAGLETWSQKAGLKKIYFNLTVQTVCPFFQFRKAAEFTQPWCLKIWSWDLEKRRQTIFSPCKIFWIKWSEWGVAFALQTEICRLRGSLDYSYNSLVFSLFTLIMSALVFLVLWSMHVGDAWGCVASLVGHCPEYRAGRCLMAPSDSSLDGFPA